MSAAVRLQDITVHLGGRPVLDRLSLTVEPGESIARVGPNGSGKTTALRCLLGLVPYTGSASVGGRDAFEDPVGCRSQLAYMPQKVAFGDATAHEVMAFAARARRLDLAAIEPALSRVGLQAHLHARVRHFSGGMLQRLSLAVLLLVDAPVLLLDEPAANLDAAGQQLLDECVRDWRARGRTLLMSCHRAEEVERSCSRTLRLENGQVSR